MLHGDVDLVLRPAGSEDDGRRRAKLELVEAERACTRRGRRAPPPARERSNRSARDRSRAGPGRRDDPRSTPGHRPGQRVRSTHPRAGRRRCPRTGRRPRASTARATLRRRGLASPRTPVGRASRSMRRASRVCRRAAADGSARRRDRRSPDRAGPRTPRRPPATATGRGAELAQYTWMPSAAFRSRRRMKSTFAGRRAAARCARCAFTSAGSPLESTASLPHAPWCSMRIQRSTRLAVAASGSRRAPARRPSRNA